jgi:hypothetical protein
MVASAAVSSILVVALACANAVTPKAGVGEHAPVMPLLAQATPTAPGTTDTKPPPAANAPKRLPPAAPLKNDQTTDQNKRYRILTDRSEEKPRPIDGTIDPNSPGGAQNRE